MSAPHGIVIVSGRASVLNLARREVDLAVRRLGDDQENFVVFSASTYKKALRQLSTDTVALVLDYDFSTAGDQWRGLDLVSRAQFWNRDVAIVVITKPKDRRLYDKKQPYAYVALGKSAKRLRKFKKEFRKQIDSVVHAPDRFK